jgi:dTDP-glucose 4,6-dehydratase
VDRSISDPSLFVKTNVLGTQVLLDAALKFGVSRFHHVSTDEVFGALSLDTKDIFTESTAYAPRSPYAASKAGSDHLVRAYFTTYGLPVTITNCSNNYGGWQDPEKFIPRMITNLLDGQSIPVYGDGKYVRDWLYVTDHCRAIDLVLQNGTPGQTYLVGSTDPEHNNLEIAKLILRILNLSEDHITYVVDRAGHDRRYAVDSTYIQKTLGWKPSVSLEEGLRQTVQWYKANEAWWQPLTLIACTKGAGVGGLILQKEAILTGPPDRHDHAIIAIFLENMRIGKF